MPVDLITLKNPSSPVADAYRTLRTNLLFSYVDQKLQSVGMTTPAQDHHKALAAANLAVTMAQSGRRTILVDSDLRRPMQHDIWRLNNEHGLSTMMIEDNALMNPPLQETEVNDLWVLTSGALPPNPVDVLGSARIEQVLQQLAQMADFLIFEMPPTLVAADALVLGPKLNGVLLIVQANKSRRDHTAKAKAQLARVGVNLLGAVLLDAPADRSTTKNYR